MTTRAMSPLRQRMLEDMQLRGLSARTQEAYTRAVAQLARHYQRSPVAIAAVPSVMGSRRRAGWQNNSSGSCLVLTFSSPSPCPGSYGRWLMPTRRLSMACSCVVPRRRCRNWRATRSIWALNSARWPCCTLGPETCVITRMSICWSLAGASHPLANSGYPPDTRLS